MESSLQTFEISFGIQMEYFISLSVSLSLGCSSSITTAAGHGCAIRPKQQAGKGIHSLYIYTHTSDYFYPQSHQAQRNI